MITYRAGRFVIRCVTLAAAITVSSTCDKDNRHRRGCGLGCECRRSIANDQGYLPAKKVRHQKRQPVSLTLGRAVLDGDVLALDIASLLHALVERGANEEWAKLRRPGAVEFVQKRLSALSKSLGDKPYLDGDRFTAGDLMMTTVLRILKHTDIVTSDKRLAAYVKRCTARPAFARAFDAQIGDFRGLHSRDQALS
jgi:Glutathione S-transferase, C-terminal domain